MSYIGDIRLGDTFDTKFVTTAATTGAPTTLAGTPVISAYVGNSVTQITAGITLTVDFDAVAGLHNVRVVASGANGFATASNYQLVITTGTVGGTSAVGYVIAEFSIEARSAIMPTTAARTLDVSASGEAGVDWANIGSPTATNALTATTIAITQKVDVETIKTNPVVNGGTITFPTTSTLASTANITAATGIVLSGVTHTGAVIPTVSVLTGHTAQTGDNFARIGATGSGLTSLATQASVNAVDDFVDTEIADIQARLPAALVGGRMDSSTGAMAAAVITAASIAADAITDAKVAADVTIASVTGAVGSVAGAVGSVTARVTANTDQINGIATSAARLARSTQGIVLGTVGAASTTTSIVTSALDPAAAVIDQYKGRIVTFDQGTATANLRGQSTDITANTAAGVLTVTALTTAAVSGDTFTIT